MKKVEDKFIAVTEEMLCFYQSQKGWVTQELLNLLEIGDKFLVVGISENKDYVLTQNDDKKLLLNVPMRFVHFDIDEYIERKREELQEQKRREEFDKKVMEKDWLDIRIKLSTEMAKLLFTKKIEKSDWLHSDQEVAARSVDIADFMIEKLKKMGI